MFQTSTEKGMGRITEETGERRKGRGRKEEENKICEQKFREPMKTEKK
jgi:hypothetical protein